MDRAEVINKIILKDKPEVRDKYTFDWLLDKNIKDFIKEQNNE